MRILGAWREKQSCAGSGMATAAFRPFFLGCSSASTSASAGALHRRDRVWAQARGQPEPGCCVSCAFAALACLEWRRLFPPPLAPQQPSSPGGPASLSGAVGLLERALQHASRELQGWARSCRSSLGLQGS